LLRFEISISAECETQNLRYSDGSDRWDERMAITHRPETGGSRERSRGAGLKGTGAAVDESIKVTIRYEAIGCYCEGSSAMQLQIDTRELVAMSKLEVSAPFVAAILLYLASPLVIHQVLRVLSGQLADGERHVRNLDPNSIPYYLTPSSISDYLEYAADVVQILPAILLPIVGALYALGNGVSAAAAVSFLVLVCILAFAVNAWVLGSSASDYASRKWHGYSVVTLMGVSINIVGLLMVIFL
jgi:hypothetical protein